MKTSSAKAKGRRLQTYVAKAISRITGIKWGKDEWIEPREMGISGPDIKLYALADEMFPFSIECKNCERWAVPKWIDQAKANQQEGTDWLLVISRNRHQPVVVMDFEAFMDFFGQYIQMVWKTK